MLWAFGCTWFYIASILSCNCVAKPPPNIEILKRRVEEEHPPIFDFKERMREVLARDNLITEEDSLNCELIFNSYMDKLRDHYFTVFEDSIENECRMNKLNEKVKWCRHECEVAMTSAIPESLDMCRLWSYRGPIEELNADMQRLVNSRVQVSRESNRNDDSRKNHSQRFSFMLPPRFRKYSKWVVYQTLLLLVNVLQSEWNRRTTRNLSAKRWADVPGLPLL